MTPLSILFIGGTGTISSAASARALEEGHEVTLLNRGQSTLRPPAVGTEVLVADVRDPTSIADALAGREFDVVIDMVAFTPEHVAQDIELFSGRVGQYVFVSSASAYQKPPLRLPIVESTPLRNTYWQYSRDKIACEDLLVAEYRKTGFPATIVRPSHTYDHTSIPLNGGWTAIDRMRRGAPVVLHDHGSSLWALTHARDFAVGFVGLLGNPHTIGSAIHITSDELLSWTQITHLLADAAGVTPNIVHVTSEAIAAADPDMGAGHLGDRSHSMIFDNSLVKSLVPAFNPTIGFAEGAREIIGWYDAHPEQQIVDPALDALFDRLAAGACGVAGGVGGAGAGGAGGAGA